jgi:hypothetical protein
LPDHFQKVLSASQSPFLAAIVLAFGHFPSLWALQDFAEQLQPFSRLPIGTAAWSTHSFDVADAFAPEGPRPGGYHAK